MTPLLPVRVTVNGTVYERQLEARLLLSDFLRHELGLTGLDQFPNFREARFDFRVIGQLRQQRERGFLREGHHLAFRGDVPSRAFFFGHGIRDQSREREDGKNERTHPP